MNYFCKRIYVYVIKVFFVQIISFMIFCWQRFQLCFTCEYTLNFNLKLTENFQISHKYCIILRNDMWYIFIYSKINCTNSYNLL